MYSLSYTEYILHDSPVVCTCCLQEQESDDDLIYNFRNESWCKHCFVSEEIRPRLWDHKYKLAERLIRRKIRKANNHQH